MVTIVAYVLQIEYGTRFYGYEIASGECSYASINVDRKDKALSSVTFIFKTEAESGVLLYIGNDVRLPGSILSRK